MRPGLRLDRLVAAGAHRRPRGRARGLVGLGVDGGEQLGAGELLPHGRRAAARRTGGGVAEGRAVLRAGGGDHVGHLRAQARPVGQRPARQQSALADAEDRDRLAGAALHGPDPADEVLHGDLDVGGGEVRVVHRAHRVPEGVEGALADGVGLVARGSGAGHEHDRLALGAPQLAVAVQGGVELGLRDGQRGVGGGRGRRGGEHADGGREGR